MTDAHIEKVLPLESVPKPDVGAPLPVLMCDEHHLLLAYLAEKPDPAWDGSYVEVVGPDTPDRPVVIVTFRAVYYHSLGPPNDDEVRAHELSSRGLMPYAAQEVESSSLVRDLLDRYSRPRPKLRHFVFTFHDSTFECVAENLQVDRFEGSIIDALARMRDSLSGAATLYDEK